VPAVTPKVSAFFIGLCAFNRKTLEWTLFLASEATKQMIEQGDDGTFNYGHPLFVLICVAVVLLLLRLGWYDFRAAHFGLILRSFALIWC